MYNLTDCFTLAMMKKIYPLLCMVLFAACHPDEHKQNRSIQKHINTPTVKIQKVVSKKKEQDIDEEVGDQTLPFYLVVADTGLNYNVLHQKMVAINKDLKIKIDTLGRFYNQKKNLIQLPDNADDEIYAGDYFLRRGEGESLSLEYLNAYKRSSSEKMIALLSGIYEKKSSADSALSVLRKTSGNAFVYKAEIYMGCMH
jgi:hypothetical protein